MFKELERRKLTLPEVKKILEERAAEGPLNDIQRRTLEYASRFSKVSYEDALALRKELEKLNIEEPYIVQIINIMPETIEELRTIFYKKYPETELLRKILEILNKYRKKEKQ